MFIVFTPSNNIAQFLTAGKNYVDFLVRNLFDVKMQIYPLPLSCIAD
jgi:hypothetical protein